MDALGRLVAGFGCRQGCPQTQLSALLHQGLHLLGAQLQQVTGLATFERRAQEPALLALAEALGLPLVGYGAIALAPFEAQLSHHSSLSWRHTGCYGVAESAALAHCQELQGGMPRLVVTRLHNAQATLALASSIPG
jgi:cobalt-precorrin 5A hydrolase